MRRLFHVINYVSMRKIINWVKLNIDLMGLTLIGAFLRLRVIVKDDLWYDEAFTGLLMRVGKEESWKIVTDDPHPPLYYLMLKGWTTVFGVNDFALRSLPVLFGILLIVVIYYLVKELFNKETADIAAFLAAVNPFLIAYSVEARSYMFYGFMTTLAAYFLVKRKFNLFVIVLVISLFVHYMFAAFLPVLLVYYAFIIIREKRGILKGLLRLVPLAAIAVFLYFPVLTDPANNNLNIDWVKEPDLYNIQQSITAYSYGVKSRLSGADELVNVNFLLDEYILGYGVFIIFIAGILAVLLKDRKNLDALSKFGFTLMMLFLPMLLLIGYSTYKDKSIYVERYLLPASVFFIIALSYILTSLLTWELLGIVVFFYVFTVTRAVTPGYYDGMKPLAQYFKNSESEVIFTSPIDYIVGKYYLDTDKVKLYDPRNPQFGYDWPFMSNARPEDMTTAVFVSPDETRMTEEFKRPLENLVFGDYSIYIKEDRED